MDRQQYGVNLGGWLVLEKWISPSVFRGTKASDEISLCRELGPDEAALRIQQHRETFITETHFKQIAERDLTVVRLPVGYWLFGDEEPYVAGADEYVDKTLLWAQKYGLGVIIDLHAAPGSQNGWDHSGQSGEVRWSEDDNVRASLECISRIATRFGQHPNLIGIEPLNEPHWEVSLDLLIDYYQQAASLIRKQCHTGVTVIVSDAFRPEVMSKALRKARVDAVLDVHLYQLFTPEDRHLDLSGHLKKTEKEWSKLLGKLTKHHHVLVGEWSGAMSELYNELGERQHVYDAEAYKAYAHEQQRVFTMHGASWTYWTARTEDGGVWSFLDQPDLQRM